MIKRDCNPSMKKRTQDIDLFFFMAITHGSNPFPTTSKWKTRKKNNKNPTCSVQRKKIVKTLKFQNYSTLV